LRTLAPVTARKNAIARRWVKSADAESEEATDENETATPPPVQPPVASTSQKEDTDGGADRVYLILVPGFTVMFVFFLINIMARSFIAERDQGTLRRLRLAPVSSASVLIGKTLPFYLTSVVQTAMLFLCGRLLFGMSWGPEPIYLIPVILCTSLAATTLGLLLATSVTTDQQVSAYGTSLVLVLGGMSGCLFPRVWLPASMKQISLATPHAWALEAFDAILTRSHVDSLLVIDCCAILIAFSAAFFMCGWWRFRTVN
jgi:ABC-2 type transport system permease protein